MERKIFKASSVNREIYNSKIDPSSNFYYSITVNTSFYIVGTIFCTSLKFCVKDRAYQT